MINTKIVRVKNEIRCYKFDEQTNSISYHVLSRYDMTRLTDIGIFIRILPYNSIIVRNMAKQWYEYTK